MVITTAQLYLTKPELRFCAGSNPDRSVSEICNGEDLGQWSQLEIRPNAFRRSTISQKQFIIIKYNTIYFWPTRHFEHNKRRKIDPGWIPINTSNHWWKNLDKIKSWYIRCVLYKFSCYHFLLVRLGVKYLRSNFVILDPLFPCACTCAFSLQPFPLNTDINF